MSWFYEVTQRSENYNPWATVQKPPACFCKYSFIGALPYVSCSCNARVVLYCGGRTVWLCRAWRLSCWPPDRKCTLNPGRDESVTLLPSKLKNCAFFANLWYHSNLNQCLFGGKGQFFLRSFTSRYYLGKINKKIIVWQKGLLWSFLVSLCMDQCRGVDSGNCVCRSLY